MERRVSFMAILEVHHHALVRHDRRRGEKHVAVFFLPRAAARSIDPERSTCTRFMSWPPADGGRLASPGLAARQALASKQAAPTAAAQAIVTLHGQPRLCRHRQARQAALGGADASGRPQTVARGKLETG
eukprot:CAMPEP_0170348248 /NCGR_PEP_ID=MMETSP0116_2-20130129/75390_1 /TAXON_ID=400756 /ORGANISM="Durinskia baltica, Strain CSIRO CS-38" /LENGTH=129 /DNA_ID=CAMNT_0010602083 /DNA_START=46 /DNA_END=432 /DNA_ORIENTATION=-